VHAGCRSLQAGGQLVRLQVVARNGPRDLLAFGVWRLASGVCVMCQELRTKRLAQLCQMANGPIGASCLGFVCVCVCCPLSLVPVSGVIYL
jgi:hypothetical protein